MWVFGYGSLMWDGWEDCFDCTRSERATFKNYHREFNKESTVNWGTKEHPGPTLGLEQEAGSECIGCSFEFDDRYKKCINYYLKGREGSSFELSEKNITLADSTSVMAIISISRNALKTYIGNRSIEERARMVEEAKGECGSCFDYVKNIHEHLLKLRIEDKYVKRMWQALQK